MGSRWRRRSCTRVAVRTARRVAGSTVRQNPGHSHAGTGDNVTLYQGVTLGGTGFARGKRHPTVDDDVVVGSGAKLLGPIHVGANSKIGANSVVIHDVPPNSTVVGNPGHPVRIEGRKPEGPDADWAHLPDPVADAIRALSDRVRELEH